MGRRVLVLGIAALAAACTSFKATSDGDGGGASSGGSSSSSSGAGSSGSGGGASSSGSSGGAAGSSGGGSSGAASSGGSSGSGSSSSGAAGDAGTATGPGPYGALPSGYCCTASTDCRNRNCVDLGGGNKMCEDECDGEPSICSGIVTGFTCLPDDGGVSSYCMPPSGTTPCLAASSYVHGTKATGTCCTPANDATNGRECLGGSCGSTGAGSNPYICANACDLSAAQPCVGQFQCQNVADYNLCIPIDPANCTP